MDENFFADERENLFRLGEASAEDGSGKVFIELLTAAADYANQAINKRDARYLRLVHTAIGFCAECWNFQTQLSAMSIADDLALQAAAPGAACDSAFQAKANEIWKYVYAWGLCDEDTFEIKSPDALLKAAQTLGKIRRVYPDFRESPLENVVAWNVLALFIERPGKFTLGRDYDARLRKVLGEVGYAVTMIRGMTTLCRLETPSRHSIGCPRQFVLKKGGPGSGP